MPTITTTQELASHDLSQLRQPRTDIVTEKLTDVDQWCCVEGPFREYQRSIKIKPLNPDRYVVTETTIYVLGARPWNWLLYFPIRHALRNRKPSYNYWWAPPDRLNQRAATVLALLAGMQLVDGYLGTVLSQTITFAADEFGHGNRAQGIVQSVVRAGVLIALVVSVLADKKGRKNLLLLTGIASCCFTVLGGISGNLWFLGGTQLLARGLSTALGVLIVIVAVEEMPAGSRAWSVSVLALGAGLGSGLAVWLLRVVDFSQSGWRIIYFAAFLGVLLMWRLGRQLPESQRFVNATSPPVVSEKIQQIRQSRLFLLAISAFLLAIYWAPASGFRNDFLKDERGFSAAEISTFTITTATPIGIGIFLGGYFAERYGRCQVGAVGIAFGAIFSSAAYFFDGFVLWSLTLLGGIFGALAVPALAVFGPELFGTLNRGKSNGILVTVGVIGSAIGLTVVGEISDQISTITPIIAILTIGPLLVAGLVLTRFPETSGLELEELNVEDA